MVLVALFVLFIVVPIAELFVIIQMGSWIGVLPTIALLIADAVLGAWLLRSQGRGAWRRFNGAVQEGRVPAREVADGGLIMFGGALLLTPGFLTDILGILMILPPTRAIMRAALTRTAMRRMTIAVTGSEPPRRTRGERRGGGPAAGTPRRAPSGRTYDVDGTAVEIDTRGLPG
jgi:UPF0716 protein FxsA